ERVVESVAAEMTDCLAGLTVDGDVVEQVDADLVVIPSIVGRVLEVPDELAGIDVERDRRIGVEVVARSRLRIHLRYWIAGAPDGQPGRRIVGTGLPDAATAGLPSVVLVLPGLAARLARLGHHVPAPKLVAGLGVERREPA